MKNIKSILNSIKKGDKDSFNNLLELHKKMIYSIINSFDCNKGDFRVNEDDLYQVGCLALYEAVDSYDDQYKAKFSTYAFNIIRNRILNEARRQTRIYNNESVSIDAYSFNDHLSHLVSENSDFYKKESKYDYVLTNVVKKMSFQDRLIIEMRKQNASYKEISKELNISTKRIDNRLSLIRRRCKKYMKELEE